MGGFSSGNHDYKIQSNSVFDTSISTTKYVSSNSLSSSDSTKNVKPDTETVDLDSTSADNKYSSNDATTSTSGENLPTVKAEEVTDFSYKQYDDDTINSYLKIVGDINGDGKLDNDDIKGIQNLSTGSSETDVSSVGILKGDIDGDGSIDITDVTIFQKYLNKEGYVPSNVRVANTLDQIKYQNTKDAVDKEIHEKYQVRDKIDSSIKYKQMRDKYSSKSSNSNKKSNTFGGWHDGYVGGKKKKTKNNTGNGDPHFGSHEAGQKQQYFYNRYKETKASTAEENAFKSEFGSLNEARDFYDTNIASLKYEQKLLDQQIKMSPYENMMATADFKKWANNHKIEDFDPEKNENLNNISKYKDAYKYLNASQLSMYNYLLETEGEESANNLLNILEDDINRQKGYEKAQSFIDRLDKDFSKIIKEDGSLMDDNDVSKLESLIDQKKYDQKYDMDGNGSLEKEDITKLKQYIETGGEIETTLKNMQISFDKGFVDGIIKFGEGFKNIFVNSDVLSPDEYKMMFIAQMLEQNGVVKGSYEFGSTVGNMVPVIVASAIMTAATAPFGGEGGALFAVGNYTVTAATVGKMTAATLIFASTYGNSKHEALCNGHSLASSIGYGLLSGLSEAGLETLLGSIPYVGKESKSLLVSMFKEGLSESAQELASSVIGYYTLGEEIDISQLSADMGKAFVYGAMLSGLGNVGKGVANMKIIINGVKYELTGAQIMEYYKASVDPNTGKSNGLTLQQYILENLPEAKTMSASQVNAMGTPMEVASKFASNEYTARQTLEYVHNGLKYGIITDEQVHQMFSNVIGKDLASWSSSPEVSTTLYKNLLIACDKANVSQQQLTQSLKLLDAMKGYYEDAKNIQEYLQSGKGTFETYRTHGIVHILDVYTKSIEATKAFESAGIEGMNIDSVMLAAIMHDTGMSGGKQLSLSVDADGNLNIKTIDVQMDGGNIRESHSFNSGVNVIENFETLREMGYSDAQIAESALLAFAHSKSNSGLNPLSSNPAGWSFAIQALQEATAGSGFDFVGALKDAGIIKDTNTKGSATVTVKAPKKYITDANGNLIDANGNIVGTEGAGKPVVSEDYNPNAKKSFKGNVGVYEFTDGTLDRLSYEALAVRIGDALTNNDNGKINQFGGEVIINDEITNYKNQSNTKSVLEAMLGLEENALPAGTTADNIVAELRKTEDGLQNAGFAETKHSTVDDSVVFEVEKDGKKQVYNNSQPFVLGENNQTYSVRGGKNGVEVVISVKDADHVPFCTLFAIEERAGELTSKGTEIMTSSAEDGTTMTMVIEINKGASDSSKALYQQYVESYANNKAIKVKLVEK